MNERKLLLDIQDLTIHYETEAGRVRAVEHLYLELGYGETLGFVGETGAGKTTTALGVMRLIPSPPGAYKGGKVLFEGEDLLVKSEAEMRSIRGGKIAMIFQDPMTSLNPVITVDRQIAEMIALHRDVNEKEALEQAVQMLEVVGIRPERAKDYPHQFSGGMKQRVVIAIALACDPALLIADEPTTALDVTVQAQIVELIQSLRDKLGMAVIWISHNLGLVAGVVERVVVMYGGFVVEEADVDALYESPLHPYTQGLLRSIPRMDDERGTRLFSIEGMPPDLRRAPQSCPFAPRCTRAESRCRESLPPLQQLPGERRVRCWLVNGEGGQA